MSRIPPIDRDTKDQHLHRAFDAIQQQLGVVPNMMRTMAQAPPVLDGYLALAGALRRGVLPHPVQEQLALFIAELNGCDYCLSAHSLLGPLAGLTQAEVEASRQGSGSDATSRAVLVLAETLVAHRGAIEDADIARARAAGLSDAAIVEVTAHVALNIFTNYFNRAVATDIDFPRVTAGARV